MTKIELRYKLLHKVDDEKLMEAVSRVHGVYGMLRVALSPALDALAVEYDASRLTQLDVEEVLRRHNLPIESANEFAA
jgi:hypothetical protein